MSPRPPFIRSSFDVPETSFCYPGSEEPLAPSRAIGRAAGLLRIGLHLTRVPPGRRTSWPHAEEKEEEFVYVIAGELDAWIDGAVHRMRAGDLAAFPAGTGISHTFLNDGDREATLLVGGEAAKPDNRIFYPLHPGRRADMPWSHWWSDVPARAQGDHDGRPERQRGASHSGVVPVGPHLELWNRGLGQVPESVFGQAELETLVLAGNGLTEVPSDIGRLQKLRMLDLGHNRLASLPSALGELERLTDFLYLHDNQLSALPAALGRLKRLRYLNIGENRFTELPDPVTEMSGLVELRASGNQLTALPESIGRLARLRELHLRDNPLGSLPESIGALAELRHLDLRGSPLVTLPASLAQLPRLEKLDLRWMRQLSVPPWLAELEARGCLVYR